MKYDIFISYRREGGYDTAKHLYDLLTRDGYRVSFDIDTLRNGDFDTTLLYRIDECKDFILIVDAHAFDRTLDPALNPQSDWLRQELAYALKKGKNIIPVFLNGINSFPNDLPLDIAGIAKKNGPEYNRYYFNDFYKRLKARFLLSKPKSHRITRILGSIAAVVLLAGSIFFIKQISGNRYVADAPVFPADMPGQEIQDNPIRIEFYGRNSANPDSYLSNEIYAKVDGYEYKIDLDPDECYTVQNQQDFDNDGVKDALICHVQACGGNAAGDSYFFIKYNGTGYFSISNEFGNNVWEEPLIENWNGQPSVVIIDTNTGFNTDSKLTLKERYILKQGNAVRVESSKKQAIRAIQEIRNSDFHNGKEEEYIHMTYDLNEDGKDESISCHYWDRWDALLFDIAIDGFIYECNTGYTRIGILESTTNGYHDLIAGDDDIFKWDGTQYKSGEVTINRQK